MDFHHQGGQRFRTDNVACLVGHDLEVGGAVRSRIKPAPSCNLSCVPTPETKVARRPCKFSNGCQSKPGWMVNIGNTIWLEKPTNLLQSGATNHHRYCNNEVNVD